MICRILNERSKKKITEIGSEYACILVIGPRQVGKSTMLKHLMEGSERKTVTLDNVDDRKLAMTDPALFLEIHPAPVLIDEVQY
ncbi:MAG: AAA family ATPase, partial [Clostridia bacterium]|nr:AAA family ATPase [Clostridia bacterium]